jgi:hypothetical protein
MQRSPRSIFALGLLVVCIAAAAPASGYQGIAENSVFNVPEGETRVTVPFSMLNNHILLDIMVDGEGPFRTVLDTGMPAPGLFLYGTEKSSVLDLDYSAEKVAVGGAGGDGKRLEARLAQDVELAIGSLKIEHASVIHTEPSNFGEYHDGIIGYSLFNRFVVELDYDNGLMHLIEPSSYVAPEGATSLPLTLRHNMPFTTVGVTALDGAKYDANVVIDIGARHAISLSVDSSDEISRPAGAIETELGHGLSGKIMGSIGRVQSLRLGEMELKQVLASFPVSAHQNPRGMDSRNGNLGNDVLRRFLTTFDYGNKRMILTPGQSYRKPFEHDMSGLRLRRDGGRVLVSHVASQTPAASAGLKPGDELVAVDGKRLSGEDIYQLRRQLAENDSELTLEIRRGERTEKHRLRLTRRV